MKSFILSLGFLISSIYSYGQVKYHYKLETAQALSRETGKPIALLIYSNPPEKINGWLYFLNDASIVKTFNFKFINYLAGREENAQPLIDKYKLDQEPWLVFIDSRGGLLRKLRAGSPNFVLNYQLPQIFAESTEASLTDLDQKYLSGDSSRAFLETYLTKRIKSGQIDNAEIVEQYARTLDDLDLDYPQTLLILNAGPAVDGAAFARVTSNKQLLDNIFQNEDESAIRVIINRILSNTLQAAIAARMFARAVAAADFARISEVPNSSKGEKRHAFTLLEYYKGIGDTTKYLSSAMAYYDEHYMKISWDSLERKMAKEMGYDLKTWFEKRKNGQIVSWSLGNNFAADLNNAASEVYHLGTTNPGYLWNAVLWAERATKFHARSHYFHTLGLLYYKMGVYTDAETALETAIKLRKEESGSDAEYQESLKKIRERIL